MTHGPMTPRMAAAAVFAASAIVLGAAFAFQYLGGLAPCVLCIWQRYPYGITMALAALAFFVPSPRWSAALIGLAGAAFLAGAGVALFHVGVEQQWWQGTAACGTTLTPADSIEDLRNRLLAQPVVRCDEVPWSLFGISMAGYNFLAAMMLAAFAFAMAWRFSRRG